MDARQAALNEQLQRCFSYENALSAMPQLPSGELLDALAEIISSSSPEDDPWHMRLRNVLQHMCKPGAQICDLQPFLGLLMAAGHVQLAAAAVAALASMCSVGDDDTAHPPKAALLHPTWGRLPTCLGAALAKPHVLEAAMAAVPSAPGRPGCVAAAAEFAVVQAEWQHNAPATSPALRRLRPALACVAADAAMSWLRLVDGPGAYQRIIAACRFVAALEVPELHAAEQASATEAAGISTQEAAAHIADILAAAAGTFAETLALDAAHAQSGHLSRPSNAYCAVHTALQLILRVMTSLACLDQPSSASHPLQASTAGTILSTFKQISSAALLQGLLSDQQDNIGSLMFEYAPLLPIALCTRPAEEQRQYLESMALLGTQFLSALPAVHADAEQLLRPMHFHAALVCSMSAACFSGCKGLPPAPTLQHLQLCAAYLVPMLHWSTEVMDDDGPHSPRVAELKIPVVYPLVMRTPTCTFELADLHQLVGWVSSKCTRLLHRQLAAGLGTAAPGQQRLAWAAAAAEAGVLNALTATLKCDIRDSPAGPLIGTLGEQTDSGTPAALLAACQAVAAAPAPPADVYTVAMCAASAVVVAGVVAVRQRRPLPGQAYRSQRADVEIQHDNACSLLAELAGKEAAVQPGALLAADLPARLFQALGLLPRDAAETWPPATAAFAATCSALAAVIRRGAGCREDFLARCPHVEETLPALLSGHRAVQAARQRICSALHPRRPATPSAAAPATPDAAAVAAAEAAAAALLAEEDQGQQQAAKRQAKASKKARQRAKKAAAPDATSSGGAMQMAPGAAAAASGPPAAAGSGGSSGSAVAPATAARQTPEPACSSGTPAAGSAAARAEQLVQPAAAEDRSHGSAAGAGAAAAAEGAAGADAATASGEADDAVAVAAQLHGVRLQGGGAAATQLLDSELDCPITLCRMTDPVLAADGQHYERSAIQAWLADHDTSPLTGLPLEHKFLIPNHMLRRVLAARSGT